MFAVLVLLLSPWRDGQELVGLLALIVFGRGIAHLVLV